MPEPAVTVLIATLGESPLLAEALQRVAAQARPLGAELLLVVNRPEADFGAAERAAWSAADRVVFEERAGKSHALNRGLAEARGGIVAFLDDDAVAAPRWLEAITAPLRAGEARLAGCGGRVHPVYPPGGPPDWYRGLVARSASTFLGPRHDLGARPREYDGAGFVVPFGANCAFLREPLRALGYQPELGPSRATGLRGGEDTEIACRLLRDGWRLRYCPEAVVYHPVEPARMTLEYVERGYWIQGLEDLRLRRCLGQPLPRAAFLYRRIATGWLRWALAALPRRRRRHRLRLRLRYYRAQLRELRHPGAAP